ncbi:MAG: restriction endonuclease subunit S [Verrucomicrobiota bacterium]
MTAKPKENRHSSNKHEALENSCSVLPSTWKASTIGNVVVKTKQRDPRNSPNEVFQYVDVSSVSNESFSITGSSSLLGSDAPSRARKSIAKNDILFATVRPTLKRIALVPEELNGEIASTGYCILRADEAKVDSSFLYFSLLTDTFTARMASIERGVSYPAVSDGDVLASKLILPPLPEQKKIAHILSTVQRAIEAQERIIQTTTALKKALMHKLFTEGLRNEPQKQTDVGPIPVSWKLCKVGDVARIQSGGTPARDTPENWSEGTIPWVKTGEIDYCIIQDTEEKITPDGLSNSAARLFPAGTLLMAMYGQGITRGRVALLAIEAATNQACASITPTEEAEVSSRFLYYWFEYNYENLRKLGHGANQRNMNAALIRSFPLALPIAAQQTVIVDTLAALDTKLRLHLRKLSELETLFRALLHELMTAKTRANQLNI